MEDVLWWIIATLASVLAAAFAALAWMLTKWQNRVERRLQEYHHHGNLLQWMLLIIQQLYRKAFNREAPDPPEEHDER